MIILLLRTFLLLAASALSGVLEAYYFHYRDRYGFRESNEHTWLVVLRVAVFFGAFISGWFSSAVAWLFPLLHDNFYYETRRVLSYDTIYPDGFWTDKSDSDTALLSFGKKTRIAFAALGIICLTIGICFPEFDFYICPWFN